MEHSRFSKTMLVADLSVCCIWLLCVIHDVENGPVWCRPVIWAVPLLRMWLSFLIYRSSRMALAPIVMLILLLIGSMSGRALSGYALFMEPIFLMLRTVPKFFGESVITADNIQGIRLMLSQYDFKVAMISSVWLILIPLGIYIWRCIRKENVSSFFGLAKRIGLCTYISFTILVVSMIVTVFHYSFVSVFMLGLFLMLIPVIFNKGKLEGLFTNGEQTFVMTLVILGMAYTCGIDYCDASTIAVLVLPALFYALVCRCISREVEYRDILTVLTASFLFVCSQYAISMYRVILLLMSLGVMSVVLIHLASSTGRHCTAAAVYVMMAILLPIFSLGYNPYSVLDARKVRHYDGYEYSPNGLMLVSGRDGVGIRDRYGLILPPEYERVEHLIPSKPYCKVMKDGEWMVYDIVRQELLSEERFTEIIPFGEYSCKLDSASGTKYLIMPRRYSIYNDASIALISNQPPTCQK